MLARTQASSPASTRRHIALWTISPPRLSTPHQCPPPVSGLLVGRGGSPTSGGEAFPTVGRSQLAEADLYVTELKDRHRQNSRPVPRSGRAQARLAVLS